MSTAKEQHDQARRVELVWSEYPDVGDGRDGSIHYVASRTQAGTWWRIAPQLVTNDAGDVVQIPVCSCPRGRELPLAMCWHRTRLLSYLNALAKARKRPTPPTNVSALVD